MEITLKLLKSGYNYYILPRVKRECLEIREHTLIGNNPKVNIQLYTLSITVCWLEHIIVYYARKKADNEF